MAEEFKELAELKKQVEDIKKMSGSSPSNVQDSMERLNKSINDLQIVFKSAIEELKSEEQEEITFSKKIEPMVKKLNTVHEQNERIAEGIVALADMLEEMKKQVSEIYEHVKEREHPLRRKYELPHELETMQPPPIPPPPIPPMYPQPQLRYPQQAQMQPMQSQQHQFIPTAPPRQPPQMMQEFPQLPPLGELPPPMPEKKKRLFSFGK